jgi:hypothetical protein
VRAVRQWAHVRALTRCERRAPTGRRAPVGFNALALAINVDMPLFFDDRGAILTSGNMFANVIGDRLNGPFSVISVARAFSAGANLSGWHMCKTNEWIKLRSLAGWQAESDSTLRNKYTCV